MHGSRNVVMLVSDGSLDGIKAASAAEGTSQGDPSAGHR